MTAIRAEAGVGEETISRRDAAELATCYAADAAGLFGYACVLVRGDRALAEDLVQAGFEAAARAWGILRCLEDEQRRGWLRATVANIAVSGFRREAAWRERLPRIEARYRKTQVTPRRWPFPRSCWSSAGRSSRTCPNGSMPPRCCAGSRG